MPAVTPAEVQIEPSHKNGIGLDLHGGEAAGELGAVFPMSHHPPPIEHPGGGEQKSARADRGRATGLPRTFTHPIDQHGIRRRRVDTFTAGDYERVDARFKR